MTKSLLRRRVHKLAFSCLGYPFHVLPTLTLFFSSSPPPPPFPPFLSNPIPCSLSPILPFSTPIPTTTSLSLPTFLPTSLPPLLPSSFPSSLFPPYLPSIHLSFLLSLYMYLPTLPPLSFSFFLHCLLFSLFHCSSIRLFTWWLLIFTLYLSILIFTYPEEPVEVPIATEEG